MSERNCNFSDDLNNIKERYNYHSDKKVVILKLMKLIMHFLKLQ